MEDAESGLPFEAVQSLCQDTRGTVWAEITQNGLLLNQTNGGWNIITNDQLVECVAADDSGGVWIGGRARLYHRHDGKLQTWTTTNGLANRIIHGVVVQQKSGICGLAATRWMANSKMEI